MKRENTHLSISRMEKDQSGRQRVQYKLPSTIVYIMPSNP